eukprot:TRINITY_DN44667_c0_g1_i2.p1 TRINITY_DN44667_c0_g1~~TRINITY_DN44667_c0_g1_i2.p1  ORF type:complete len:294 (-),score=76.06 TRINITY_DN44667_c0_g1_i2:114-995(-)
MNECLSVIMIFFFFFKQKTAYEMLRSLVGSEMCIRDSARRYFDACLPARDHDLASRAVSYHPTPSSLANIQLESWQRRLVQVLAPGLHHAAFLDGCEDPQAPRAIGWDDRVVDSPWEQLGAMKRGLALHHVAQMIKSLQPLGWSIAQSRHTPRCLTPHSHPHPRCITPHSPTPEIQGAMDAAAGAIERAVNQVKTKQRSTRRQVADPGMVDMVARDSHDRWVVHYKALGWGYGSKRSVDLRTDPMLVPFECLGAEAREGYVRNVIVVAHALKRLGCYIAVSYTHLTLPTKRIV